MSKQVSGAGVHGLNQLVTSRLIIDSMECHTHLGHLGPRLGGLIVLSL